ncbi:hypothetical protein [Dysgonomonas macrotermitis]|nr:hypothetical protein [Dysgonomonas macrotermitis]
MKKKALLLLGIFSFGVIYAQVGINTQSPLGIFHVDPLSNTNTVGTVNVTDDVIINQAGNIGVGQLPRTDVKINLSDGGTVSNYKPVFQLQDGNEGIGKLLVSDASGNATWKNYMDFGLTIGKFGAGIYFSPDPTLVNSTYGITARASNNGVKTTGQITLGKGLWWVRCSLYVSAIATTIDGRQIWARTTLADDSSFGIAGGMAYQMSTDLLTNHTLASTLLWLYGSCGVIYGSFLLDNRSMAASSKTYYLVIGWIDSYDGATPQTILRTGLSTSGENSIYAYRVEE